MPVGQTYYDVSHLLVALLEVVPAEQPQVLLLKTVKGALQAVQTPLNLEQELQFAGQF